MDNNKKMNPKISVIIPVYNVAMYLPKCLDSVIHQTYTNIEIMLIDDGSTDNCYEICKKYETTDKRIKVFQKENGGLSDARNYGIKCCSGQLITFVDSDDVITLDYVAYLYDLYSKNADISISVCQWDYLNESDEIISNDNNIKKDYITRSSSESMKDYFINNGINTVSWGKLYDKELFNDIFFPYGKYHEDVYTTYKLISKSKAVSIGKGKKYLYRIRKQSISRASFTEKHFDSLYATIERLHFIEKYHPECILYARSSIISSANNLVLKMVMAQVKDIEHISLLTGVYKEYSSSYFNTSKSLFNSFFVLLCWLDIGCLVRTGSLLSRFFIKTKDKR